MSHFVMVVKFLIFDVMTWNPEGASNHSKWPETGVWSVTRNLQTYQQEDVLDNSIRLDLATGSQQNMESEGRRAVARVATYSHQLTRQSRLEPRVL